MKKWFFKMFFCGLCSVIVTQGFSTQRGYDQGRQYGAPGVPLGDPDSVDNGFLKRGQDVSNLTRLNDTQLSGRGKKAGSALDALQTDSGANLLVASEGAKLNASEEHKINPENAFFADSMLIENNPLEETGGTENRHSTTVIKETEEFCNEGVEFEVDIVRQLAMTLPQKRSAYEGTIVVGRVFSRGGGVGSAWVRTRTPDPSDFSGFGEGFSLKSSWNSLISLMWSNKAPARRCGLYQLPCPSWQDFYAQSKKGKAWGGLGHDQHYLYESPRRLPEEHIHYYDGCTHYGRYVINFDRYEKKVPGSRWQKITQKEFEAPAPLDEDTREFWEVITPDTESLMERHNCYEVRRACLDSGRKDINGWTVNRDCWKEQITYVCRTEPLKGCKYLQKKGCRLENSVCVDDSLYPCAKWRRQYKCVREEERISLGIKGSGMFCLGGDCFTPKIGQNTDLNQAVAYLSVFKEIQKDMQNHEPPTFFKGDGLGCGRHLANFTNCCSSMAGWGIGLGLSQCSENEKMLATKKDKKLCHYVGTYCSNKIPLTGICLTKKSVYCCFGSKLSRLFHEQGRAQLGKGWGSAECPDCGPFTSFDLQNINFEEMDFSELFHDLFKGLDDKALKAIPHQMKNQMPISQAKLEELREKRFTEGGRHVEETVF